MTTAEEFRRFSEPTRRDLNRYMLAPTDRNTKRLRRSLRREKVRLGAASLRLRLRRLRWAGAALLAAVIVTAYVLAVGGG
ncbi:hypothetical protein [Actinomadura nitritigenes]|uniref:hypothetical protein n=1 Tax=Actinomadura nitritigenes TaxID=134602 RepID=UPI003D943CFB